MVAAPIRPKTHTSGTHRPVAMRTARDRWVGQSSNVKESLEEGQEVRLEAKEWDGGKEDAGSDHHILS